MGDMEMFRLLIIGMSVLFILIAVIMVAVSAATASRYSVYQGTVVSYFRNMREGSARPTVEFMADGQLVTCQANSMRYRQVKALEGQQVQLYAYKKQGFLGETWHCYVDTGSPFSRPGVVRVLPIAAIFAAGGVFFLFLLMKIGGMTE